MQHYEPASSRILRHQYDTPTFKTNALCLVSNEGRLRESILRLWDALQLKSSLFSNLLKICGTVENLSNGTLKGKPFIIPCVCLSLSYFISLTAKVSRKVNH